MKSNIITAAIILTGCLCAWGYLAAQSDVPYSSQFIQTLPLPSQTAQPNNPPSTYASPQTTYPTNPFTYESTHPTTGHYYGGEHSYGSSPSAMSIAMPISPLLVIKEPLPEDFEQCAQRAVDFMESWSRDQAKNETALNEFLESPELTPQQAVATNTAINAMTATLTYMKNETTYGCPELIGTRSFGENVIILYYNYQNDKYPLYCRFGFERPFDKNGEPLKWRCQPADFYCDSNLARVYY